MMEIETLVFKLYFRDKNGFLHSLNRMFCGEEIDVGKYYDNDKKALSMDSLDFLHQHVIAVLKQYSRIKPEHVSMINLLEIYSSYYDIDDYVHDV